LTSENPKTIIASDAASEGFDEEDFASPPPILSAAAHVVATHEFTVSTGQHGLRLDRVLTELLPDSSRSFLQQLIDSGDVRVGGLPASKASAKLKAGERLVVHQRPLPQDTAFTPDAAVAQTLRVVFEDEHLLVIDKAPGLVVHPAAGNWSGTLLNGLLARHECHTLLPRAGIVHRLDKDTSGLMVVARTREAMDRLIALIAARDVKRQYLALAHYPWRGQAERTVDAPIGRDPRNRQRMAVVDLAQYPGKEAVTDFELLANSHGFPAGDGYEFDSLLSKEEQTSEYFRRQSGIYRENAPSSELEDLAADAFCLLRCSLHTGRTHQIRVHAAKVHHPLVADTLYGGRCAVGLTRQALHAERLAFVHPITEKNLSFHAPMASDMQNACRQLGFDYNLA
jgi:23S rRNA pseudouridine1911/1915/1917 synthase